MEPHADPRSSRASPHWRRVAHLGVATALTSIAMLAWGKHLDSNAKPSEVMLLYVGAEDCAPCRAWRNGEGATFLASAELARITYREVKSPHLADVLNNENWPEDLRTYRNYIKPSDGVPLWLVVADRTIVEQEFGASAWRDSILPRIKGLITRGPP